MKKNFTSSVIVAFGVILVLLTIACQTKDTRAPSTNQVPAGGEVTGRVLILGDVSSDPAGTIADFQPIADYLAAQMTDLGFQRGGVVVAPDLSTMEHYLETGQVDLYFDSAFPAITIHNAVGADLLLRRWKKGTGTFHTLIVVNKASGITELDGLVGQAIAFDDAVSTSGYLLPKAHLEQLGYHIDEIVSPTSAISDTAIGFVFANGEENVQAWVLRSETSAGAIRDIDFERLPADVKNQLTILSRTVELPRHIVLARPEMNDVMQTRIVEVLSAMDQTVEGQAILASFERTSKFDELPGGQTRP